MKKASHNTFYFAKLALMLAAIVVLVVGTDAVRDTSNILIIISYLIIGYIFGMITCNIHSKKTGAWITFLFFALLNMIHSLIDGITLTTIAIEYRNLAIYSHELIRQPALYVFFWAMLSPFNVHAVNKVFISILAVTGIWLLGMHLGTSGGYLLGNLHIADKFLSLSIFIFIGDILHHLYDDFPYRNHNH